MDLLTAISSRHSVRSYSDQSIEGEVLQELQETIDQCNSESGLHIQLCLNEPQSFSGMKARYSKFQNVRNYLALVGAKGPDLQELCGYYGEKVVLKAEQLGLNTCWVAASYSKSKSIASVAAGEKLLMVISIGYGANSGKAHQSKTIAEVCAMEQPLPEWFQSGIEAALLAPTAMNQQKFFFELSGNKVIVRAGNGIYTKTDLGIVKYHFEVGAGDNDWHWA